MTRYEGLRKGETLEVKADSVDKAIDIAHQIPLDDTKAAFMLGSLNSDPYADVTLLSQKGPS